MKYPILLVLTALVALFNPLGAAVVWTVTIAIVHAGEETQGKLWSYFGEIAGADFLKKISTPSGFVLIVLPAVLLQLLASWNAFSGDTVNVFWLAVLLGARLGDALFSHAIPFASGYAGIETGGTVPVQRNPGLASAAIYVVDSLVLLTIWRDSLVAGHSSTIVGVLIGAGFFAVVQPGLRLTDRFLKTIAVRR